jgi:hypothetical protein
MKRRNATFVKITPVSNDNGFQCYFCYKPPLYECLFCKKFTCIDHNIGIENNFCLECYSQDKKKSQIDAIVIHDLNKKRRCLFY